MDQCIFCKIVAGQAPSHRVYEDDTVLAFLDIAPINEGHVVVIPKNHEEQLWDLEEDISKHLMSVTTRIALHLRSSLNSFRVGSIVEGMEVPHAHINLVPLNSGFKQTLNDRVASEPDHVALEVLATRLYLV